MLMSPCQLTNDGRFQIRDIYCFGISGLILLSLASKLYQQRLVGILRLSFPYLNPYLPALGAAWSKSYPVSILGIFKVYLVAI